MSLVDELRDAAAKCPLINFDELTRRTWCDMSNRLDFAAHMGLDRYRFSLPDWSRSVQAVVAGRIEDQLKREGLRVNVMSVHDGSGGPRGALTEGGFVIECSWAKENA
jgi:hypothetical protein